MPSAILFSMQLINDVAEVANVKGLAHVATVPRYREDRHFLHEA